MTESFRLLVESVQDYAIFVLDVDGHVATWNRGAERIKGYAAEEIIGRHFSAFYPPADIAADKPGEELRVAIAEGRVEDEGWRLRKDGSRFWANVVITALRDGTGALRGFAKVTRDLTARKEAEETARELARAQAARAAAEEAEGRIREERERFRALSRRLEVILEAISDGITVQDRAGRIIFANSAAARYCGCTVDELLAAEPSSIVSRFELLDERGAPFDPRDLPGRQVLAGVPSASVVLRVRELDRRHQWWTDIRASPVLDEAGVPELAVNVWHDVTADRRREEADKYLARATASLASSLDYATMLRAFADILVPGFADWCVIHLLAGDALESVAVAHVDPSRVLAARDYALRYPPDPSSPSGAPRVARTGEPELYTEISDELLRASATDAEQLAILRSVGMRSLVVVPIRVRERVVGTISLVAAESGRRYDRHDVALAEELGRRAGTAIENARLYEAEKAARTRSEVSVALAEDAARAAEEASRVKDEFLATVSHELRTPLNAIVGWASMLRDRIADPWLAKGMAVIHRNAQAQGKIIEDILDVSRIITGKLRLDLQPADLVAVVEDAVEVVRPSATAKRIRIVFDLPNERCVLVADPERLRQVVWNILSNAVKFSDPEGTITIVVGREQSSLRLTIADTGRGIEPGFLPYVFDRFKQADASTTRRVGGLGLGLAIVRHIVELHGGQVEAKSEGVGRGASFSILLPVRALAPEDAVREAVEAAGALSERRPSTSSLDGLRVLVVDDEPDARDLLAALLERAGARVEVASSAAQAFDSVQTFRPDVVVSDVGMPDEDGYALMRRIRALAPASGGGVPSIALTAYARAEDKTKALGAGFTTHIGKPVDANDLLAAVKNLAGLVPKVT